jgi:hypothetical protein
MFSMFFVIQGKDLYRCNVHNAIALDTKAEFRRGTGAESRVHPLAGTRIK